MSRRVDAFASVVRTQTRSHVVSHASVVAIAIAEAADHIHETFLLGHDRAMRNVRAGAKCQGSIRTGGAGVRKRQPRLTRARGAPRTCDFPATRPARVESGLNDAASAGETSRRSRGERPPDIRDTPKCPQFLTVARSLNWMGGIDLQAELAGNFPAATEQLPELARAFDRPGQDGVLDVPNHSQGRSARHRPTRTESRRASSETAPRATCERCRPARSKRGSDRSSTPPRPAGGSAGSDRRPRRCPETWRRARRCRATDCRTMSAARRGHRAAVLEWT